MSNVHRQLRMCNFILYHLRSGIWNFAKHHYWRIMSQSLLNQWHVVFCQRFKQKSHRVNCHFLLINFPKIYYKLCSVFHVSSLYYCGITTHAIFFNIFWKKNAFYELINSKWLEGVTGIKNKHRDHTLIHVKYGSYRGLSIIEYICNCIYRIIYVTHLIKV